MPEERSGYPPERSSFVEYIRKGGIDALGASWYDTTMKITTKTTGLDLTPSLRTYIETKLGALAKFVKRFDETGQAELWVEVARTTRHHRHGDVFSAEADLRLPKKVLRAEEEGEDVRAAIDLLQRKLHLEIEKYKTRFASKPTKRSRAAARPGK